MELIGRTYNVEMADISMLRERLEWVFDKDFAMTPNISYDAKMIKPFSPRNRINVELYIQTLKDVEDSKDNVRSRFNGSLLIPSLDKVVDSQGEILVATVKNKADTMYLQKYQLVLNYVSIFEETGYVAQIRMPPTLLEKTFRF